MPSNIENKQHSLIKILSMYLVVSLITISAITYLINYNIALDKANKELRDKANQNFSELKEVIKTPLWNLDNREIQIIGKTYLANNFASSIKIENSNKQIVFNGNNHLQPGLFTLKSTIQFHDTIVGYVQYAVSKNSLEAIKRNFIWSYLVNILSIMIGTLFVAGFFLRSVITSSFKNFGKAVTNFTTSKETKFEIKSSYSEFMPLIAALQQMSLARTEAEAATSDAVQLTENILAASPIGIAVYDAHGQCVSANDSFCNIIGITKEHALSQNYHRIDSWKQAGIYNMANHAMNRQCVQHAETQIKINTGKVLSLDCQFVPIITRDQAHLLLMASDITERKNTEHELDSYRHKLEERVEERTKELCNAQEKLIQRERLATIGQLTGGIAHDFNNILAIISGYNELTLEVVEQNNDSKIKSYSEEIANAIKRATTLVSQLLTFSRGAKTEPSILPVEPLIKETLKLLQPTVPSSITLKTQFEHELPPIYANATQVQQMLVNLCINARDAIKEKGEIKFTTTLIRADQMSCSSCHQSITGKFIALAVVDNGHGIAEQNAGYIFDPFFTTKEIGKGSGMGLSVIHGIMHNYDGHILVDSSPKGSCFKLLFPISEQAQQHAELPAKDNITAATH